MKTDLTFLPELKQQELAQLTAAIVKLAKPAIVILFGSYARGQWVDDAYIRDGINYSYKSDYDILVVMEHETGRGDDDKLHTLHQLTDNLDYSAPVTLIQHGLNFLKKELKTGSYFFTDIIKDGIVLYDKGAFSPDLKPGDVDLELVKARAIDDFEHWYASAGTFLKAYKFCFSESDYNTAAFQLHQTTERYYSALLLAFINYKPKLHDIKLLRRMSISIMPIFSTILSDETEQKKEAFTRLRKAYIDARYNKHYSITVEELEYLSAEVQKLKELVDKVCREKLGI